MFQYVVDIEGDSLTPNRLWCLAAHNLQLDRLKSTTEYGSMKKMLAKADVIVGHNFYRFDAPVLERILGVEIKAKIVDTLALSWYLYPERNSHGLEAWGEDLGVKKPPIIRWDDPDMIDEYVHRCEEDVKINTKLWKKMYAHLLLLYGTDEEVWRFIDYLMFKMDCAREQERSRWKLDVELCTKNAEILTKAKQEAVDKLIEVMPKVPTIVKKSKPAKPYKKDGSYSVTGANWFKLLRDHNLPEDYDGEVEVIMGYEPGNPNSTPQIKKWLFDSGWVPDEFKIVKDDDGNIREIPQINKQDRDNPGLCESVTDLFDVHPELVHLDGLGVVSHRLGILNGFLEAVDDEGYVQAQIAGITNTMRFKHKTVVNIPGVDKPYGKICRGVLIAPEGYEQCGSDMSSLEDRLKCHYLHPYDPEYAAEISTPGYDAHMSLAISDGAMTEKQMEDYKSGVDKSVAPVRKRYKSVNYAAQYGAGGPRIAIAAGTSEKKGYELHKAYWKKNWAIKEVAKHQTVKTVKNQMWLQNPINKFWYPLRYEKDIFSTLVQGSASFVFDMWVKFIREKRNQLTGQFHDEVILTVKKGHREKCTQLIKDAMKKLNETYKLNRDLDCEVQFGDRYSDIH